ncbi:hypothetical protein DPMN_139493 [Dreissena polymorpha]|uniref:Uncharacterized protein n=1 Tax=Dreissena polymorpha TaxID=45954 RepID=A0A9D4G5U3_DREPO|nr:hypothetical protein DPMN_139493 [Dreissena polymorpha]
MQHHHAGGNAKITHAEWIEEQYFNIDQDMNTGNANGNLLTKSAAVLNRLSEYCNPSLFQNETRQEADDKSRRIGVQSEGREITDRKQRVFRAGTEERKNFRNDITMLIWEVKQWNQEAASSCARITTPSALSVIPAKSCYTSSSID